MRAKRRVVNASKESTYLLGTDGQSSSLRERKRKRERKRENEEKRSARQSNAKCM